MNQSKKPTEEPRKSAQPNPRTPNEPIAKTGDKGEGSYTGTRQYDEGLEKFSESVPNEEAIRRAKQIDPNDPALKKAEQEGKEGRTSSASIH